MFLLIAGIVMLVIFGPVGMFVFAPGLFMLVSVTAALFLEVRIKESNRLKRSEQEYKDRSEKLTELKKASEIRERSRASAETPKTAAAQMPKITVSDAPAPSMNAEKEKPENFEGRLISALGMINLNQLMGECGIKVNQPSRVDFSVARDRSSATAGAPAVLVSFELSRKWLNRLPLRQRQDLVLKLEEAVCTTLFPSADESDFRLLGDRVGPVCISGWAKITRVGAPAAVRVSRECLISISGSPKNWKSYGEQVCRAPEGPHPSPGLYVRWAGGHAVEAYEAGTADKADIAFLHKDFTSI